MLRVLFALLLPIAAIGIVGGVAAVVLWDEEVAPSTPPASLQDETPSGAPRLAPESNVCQGILRRPDASAPRTFPAEYSQRREAAGFVIVGNEDVSPDALDKAAETVEDFFENNDLEDGLVAEGAYVIVAEADQGVLDLPEFRCLDNARNQDFYNHVCGVADRADYPVVTVNEMDLVGKERGPCGGLNILYHELGHMVQGWVLPHPDYIDVRQFFQDAKNEGKYRGDYAATNANEYFAEATQAYFLSADRAGRRDREWLEEYDPQIFELLDRTYRD